MIKKTSKTLTWSYNYPIKALKYHDTVVLSVDVENKLVTFKHGGWKTRNTAKAICYALESFLGLHGKVIARHRKCKSTGNIDILYLEINTDKVKRTIDLVDGMTLHYKELGIESLFGSY